MSDALARVMRLYTDTCQKLGEARQEADNRILAIAAGQATIHTLFGKPVVFSVSWPEGAPFGKTDEEMRQWCAELLAGQARRMVA